MDTISKEKDRKIFLDKVIVGLLNEIKKNTSTINKIADKGLKDSFLFSGKYTQWFMDFSKKDVLLLEFLLDYQRENRNKKLNSLEERLISDIYLEFLSDENHPDSFEATYMFTEMQLNMDPPPQVKNCVTSPNFLNVVHLAIHIGRTMRGFEEIMSCAEFYEKFIHTVEQMAIKKKAEKGAEQGADVTRNLNVVIALLYDKMKTLNYSFNTSRDLPMANIGFEDLMKIWIYVLESLIETIVCPKKNEMGITVFANNKNKKVIVDFFVVCDAKDLESHIEAFKSMKIDEDEEYTYDYTEIHRMITSNGGDIDFAKKDESGMTCTIQFPYIEDKP